MLSSFLQKKINWSISSFTSLPLRINCVVCVIVLREETGGTTHKTDINLNLKLYTENEIELGCFCSVLLHRHILTTLCKHFEETTCSSFEVKTEWNVFLFLLVKSFFWHIVYFISANCSLILVPLAGASCCGLCKIIFFLWNRKNFLESLHDKNRFRRLTFILRHFIDNQRVVLELEE